MSGWQALQSAVRQFVSRPTVRGLNAQVLEGSGAKQGISGRTFIPEASYFSVRVVEIFLAESGKYFSQFLPLGVCVAEFSRGAVRQRVPLVLSNDFIEQMLAGQGERPGFVQFKNMYVVRRVPVKADNLSLFTGLFRMPYNDIAKRVLQIAADVTEELGGVALAGGVKVADKVYDRVASLFQLNEVQPRFGFIDGNSLTESRYLIVAGSLPDGVAADSLRVVDSELQVVEGTRMRPAEGFDYCLLAIEHHESLFDSVDSSINSLTGLPFDARWRDVVTLLAAKKGEEADQALLALRAAVVVSADLTEQDRLVTIAAYDTAFLKFSQALLPKPKDATGGMRSARSGTPIVGLKGEADLQKRGGQSDVAKILNTVALRLQMSGAAAAPDSDKPEMAFAAEAAHLRKELQQQGVVGKVSSARLAEALSLAANRTV